MFSKGTQKVQKANLNNRFVPIPPRNLKPNKFYTIIHRKDPLQDVEGIYVNATDGNPRFNIINKIVGKPSSEFIFYPISSSRRILRFAGQKIPEYNPNFPNRNSPYFDMIPNAKRTRQRSKTRRIRKN
jgi:hypothetical protein